MGLKPRNFLIAPSNEYACQLRSLRGTLRIYAHIKVKHVTAIKRNQHEFFPFTETENNVVQWNAPGLESPPSNNNSRPVSPNFTSNESLNSNRRINEFKSVNKRRGSVYDKLTDYSLYTGSSKNRFDNTGHGITDTEEVTTTATNGTKRQQRVRRQSHYSGSTNTKSDEIFHDASEFLVRNDYTAPVGGPWR